METDKECKSNTDSQKNAKESTARNGEITKDLMQNPKKRIYNTFVSHKEI